MRELDSHEKLTNSAPNTMSGRPCPANTLHPANKNHPCIALPFSARCLIAFDRARKGKARLSLWGRAFPSVHHRTPHLIGQERRPCAKVSACAGEAHSRSSRVQTVQRFSSITSFLAIILRPTFDITRRPRFRVHCSLHPALELISHGNASHLTLSSAANWPGTAKIARIRLTDLQLESAFISITLYARCHKTLLP